MRHTTAGVLAYLVGASFSLLFINRRILLLLLDPELHVQGVGSFFLPLPLPLPLSHLLIFLSPGRRQRRRRRPPPRRRRRAERTESNTQKRSRSTTRGEGRGWHTRAHHSLASGPPRSAPSLAPAGAADLLGWVPHDAAKNGDPRKKQPMGPRNDSANPPICPLRETGTELRRLAYASFFFSLP